MRVLWHCEAEPFARRVLEHHWPGIPCYEDVRELRGADVEPVDILAGGFPCQDLSRAGTRTGLDGARSGLWSEYARLVGELRPRYVCVENVPGILVRGLERVLGDLAALGYDAEWDCLSASAFGAPHVRDRFWLVAYPQSDGRRPRGTRRPPRCGEEPAQQAHPRQVPNADSGRHGTPPLALRAGRERVEHGRWWPDEPAVARVAHGLPDGVDRRRALGNALVPGIAEWIGRRIVAYELEREGLAA